MLNSVQVHGGKANTSLRLEINSLLIAPRPPNLRYVNESFIELTHVPVLR